MRRTAAVAAAFLLPHLRPGMRVLDCGCGPGSITLGLAEAVQPGEVVGIDPDAARLDLARTTAAERGIGNVRFEVGDVTALPFPDGSFDAALVHAVAEHLEDPVGALAEVRRVLKPGGVVGVRSPEHSEAVVAPPDPIRDRTRELSIRANALSGHDVQIARALRAVLRAAGFVRVVGTASVEAQGTPEDTRQHAEDFVGMLTHAPWAKDAVAHGLIDGEELERMRDAWRTWGEHPDAFYAAIWCEAVGWAE